MLRMLPQFALRLLAVLASLGLNSCADTLTSGQPIASNSELQREYDKTMTKSEQKNAISDLEQEKQRQERVVKQDNATTGAAGPAEPTAQPTDGSN